MDMHHELITPNLRTTSRVVAEKFGKRHDNVLRDITSIKSDVPEEFWLLNFEERDYLDSRGKTQPQYELTRDGFVLLAMGFTGAAAMEWKVRFIEAFNMMEAELSAKLRGEVGAELRPSIPAHFGDDLTTREKLSAIRETRLLHGIKAGRRMWAMLDFPHVADRIPAAGLLQNPEDGRACLEYLLGLDVAGRTVGEWLAEGADNPALNRVRLRVLGDGLFVANATQVFAGSRWAAGAHRVALIGMDGVHTVPNPLSFGPARLRGLVIPMAVIAGGFHA